MKDFLGQTLTPGDQVVYPGSVGRSMKKEMVVGTLLSYKTETRQSMKYDYTQQRYKTGVETYTTAKIRTEKGSRAEVSNRRWEQRTNGTVVTIFNTNNIVKVNVSV